MGPAILTANSYHPGGVNVCRVDGSVIFVSESIDSGRLNEPAYRSAGGQDSTAVISRRNDEGPSAYGVWGAMGTKDGGEAISL